MYTDLERLLPELGGIVIPDEHAHTDVMPPLRIPVAVSSDYSIDETERERERHAEDRDAEEDEDGVHLIVDGLGKTGIQAERPDLRGDLFVGEQRIIRPDGHAAGDRQRCRGIGIMARSDGEADVFAIET